MDDNLAEISFRYAEKSDLSLIREWFLRPHVSEYFDDPDTGLSVPDLKKFINSDESFWSHWVGCSAGHPFMYLMTSEVKSSDDGIWGRWRDSHGQTYTLDVFIGDENFIGKGMSHLYIRKFIQDHFPHAARFLIDPEVANKRAIHVYEKAGFRVVENFAPSQGVFAGVPHVMMRLELPFPT